MKDQSAHALKAIAVQGTIVNLNNIVSFKYAGDLNKEGVKVNRPNVQIEEEILDRICDDYHDDEDGWNIKIKEYLEVKD